MEDFKLQVNLLSCCLNSHKVMKLYIFPFGQNVTVENKHCKFEGFWSLVSTAPPYVNHMFIDAL